MGITYNPFSGQFDITGAAGGGSSVPFVDTFIVGDWVVNGVDFDITYPLLTHNKGLNPIIQVFELNGSDYEEVLVLSIINNVSGLLTIRVSGTPDLRFQGKIVVK